MISFHQKNRQEIWRRRLPGEMMDWEWEGVAGGGRAWKGDWSGVRGRWGRGRAGFGGILAVGFFFLDLAR